MFQVMDGLDLYEGFVTSRVAKFLVDVIDSQEWSNVLKRRTQHYGYRYDYKKRNVSPSDKVPMLPEFSDLLQDVQIRFGILPNQIIVNEYEPGQGIGQHIDCEPCFGDTVFSLSLLSDCHMRMTRPGMADRFVLMPENSLLVMSGCARYDWKHGINKTKKEFGVERRRRISLTMRTVIVGGE